MLLTGQSLLDGTTGRDSGKDPRMASTCVNLRSDTGLPLALLRVRVRVRVEIFEPDGTGGF